MFKRVCLLLGACFLFAFYAPVSEASSVGRHYINMDGHMFEVPAVTVKKAEECFAAVFMSRNYSSAGDEGAVIDNVKSGIVMADVWYKKYVLVFFSENGSDANPKTATQIFKGAKQVGSAAPDMEQLSLTAKACNDQIKVVF